MSPAPLTPDLRALAPGFAARFAIIMLGLAKIMAIRFDRHPRFKPLAFIIWNRFVSTHRRFTAIMTRLAAGRTPRRDPRQDRVRANTSTSATQPKIPNTNAWLGIELKHEAATWRARLEALLAEPGMAELLAAEPALNLILNPIRIALGMQTDPPRFVPPTPPPPPPPKLTAEELSYLWPFRTPSPHLRLKPT